jgi:phosphatidylserine/phosphatidylglycerophosphate/cardiolipin synthase-like enzyme
MNIIKHFFFFLLLSFIFSSQIFFSPGGGTREQLVQLIQTTTGDISIAIFSFTSKELAMALLKENKEGRNIRIIADRGQAQSKYSVLNLLNKNNIEVKYLPVSSGRGMMHHKFMVIDGAYLVTGSYNWSTNAESFNNENTIILKEKEFIKQYILEFERLWSEAVSYDKLR